MRCGGAAGMVAGPRRTVSAATSIRRFSGSIPFREYAQRSPLDVRDAGQREARACCVRAPRMWRPARAHGGAARARAGAVREVPAPGVLPVPVPRGRRSISPSLATGRVPWASADAANPAGAAPGHPAGDGLGERHHGDRSSRDRGAARAQRGRRARSRGAAPGDGGGGRACGAETAAYNEPDDCPPRAEDEHGDRRRAVFVNMVVCER